MGKTPLPVPADLRNYHLPIGGLGFLNQLLHFYFLMMIICGQRPLSPWRPIRHPKYVTWLCSILLICIVSFDCDSLAHLHNWQHITSVVGNMILFLSFTAVTIGARNPPKLKEVTGPQADTVRTTKPVTVNEHQEPHRSSDLEKGEIVNEETTKSLDVYRSWPLDADVVGVPENPANRIPTEETAVMETMSTSSTTVHEDTSVPPAPSQTSESKPDTTEDAFLFMLICNGPPTIIVFAGLVGQLAQNLPTDWRDISQIRSIIVAFSVFLVVTVLITASFVLSALFGNQSSDKSASRKKWKDSIMMGVIILSFFVVAFDKWLLAALADDISGVRHIVSHGRVPLAYMIVTNLLPALAF